MIIPGSTVNVVGNTPPCPGNSSTAVLVDDDMHLVGIASSTREGAEWKVRRNFAFE